MHTHLFSALLLDEKVLPSNTQHFAFLFQRSKLEPTRDQPSALSSIATVYLLSGGTLELFAGILQPVDVGQQYVPKMISLLVRGIQEFSID